MRRRIAAAALAASLALALTPNGVAAQPATGPQVAAVTPKAEALVRRLMKAMRFESTIDSMLASMMPVMIEQQAKLNPNITADDQKMIVETGRQIMRETFTPKLIARAVPIYAATFSESELEQMVAFYESPAGQSIITKMPLMGPKMAEATRDLMPEATADMARAMCAKMNCLQPAPASIPKTKPS